MTSAPKVHASLHPTAYLDPSCSVRGQYRITVHKDVLVHPRTTLSTDTGALTIGENSIICEGCTIGTISGSKAANRGHGPSESVSLSRPVETITENVSRDTRPVSMMVSSERETLNLDGGDIARIGDQVMVSPAVVIEGPCQINDGVVIESGVTIARGCTIGAHSKVCAGVRVPQGAVIPEWTVVYGPNGTLRRQRGKDSEEQRSKNLRIVKVGEVEILKKSNASKGTVARGGSDRSKVKRPEERPPQLM